MNEVNLAAVVTVAYNKKEDGVICITDASMTLVRSGSTISLTDIVHGTTSLSLLAAVAQDLEDTHSRNMPLQSHD